MSITFNLNLAENLAEWQKTAIKDAALSYTNYLKDDVVVDLFFANSDNFPKSVTAGAIPTFVGGLKSGLNYELPNTGSNYNFWNHVYSDGNNADVITFDRFFKALKADRTSYGDKVHFNSLSADLYNDGYDNTVNIFNSVRAEVPIKGIQLTSANASALDLAEDSDIDGIVVFNPLAQISALEEDFIAEYNHTATFNATTYQGVIQVRNQSGADVGKRAIHGNFVLEGRIVEHWSDLANGGLIIKSETSVGNGKYRYAFKTADNYFADGEINHLGFTARKTNANSLDGPRYVAMANNGDMPSQPKHFRMAVLSEANPIYQDYYKFKAVAMHEIGHTLGFTSAVDNTSPELGQYSVKSYELGDLTNEEKNLTVEEQFRINPLDLTRYTNFGGGTGVKRSLNPDVVGDEVKDLYFSQNGGRHRLASFAVGQHLNEVDYLTGQGQYYYQGSHWKGGSQTGILDPNVYDVHEAVELSNLDLRAFDLIGWDVNFKGTSVGEVNVIDWNNELDADIADVLHLRGRRKASSSTRSRRENPYQTEDGEIFANSAESYDNFLGDLADDLARF